MNADTPAAVRQHGGCLCGQVRYTLDTASTRTVICHCRHCQKQSGSAFSVNVLVPAAQLQLQGELATYIDTAASGRQLRRRFCVQCGSPIVTEPLTPQPLLALKAGSLDDSGWLSPVMHLWCVSAQPWLPFTDELPKLQRQPGQ